MARKKTEDAKETKPSDSSRKAKLLDKAKERYKDLSEYWAENRRLALEDIKFRAGEQWPEKIKAKRDKSGRPALVLDKLNQYIRQVVNDGRQNRPQIKFRPVEDGDMEVAEAFQGITRSILAQSNADEALDTALDHAAGSGFGFVRVLTDYKHEGSFEQDIQVLRVRNPLSVLISPHNSADGADIEDGFVVDMVSKSDFERRWPKADKTDWKADGDDYGDWMEDELVRVAEYWYKEPTEKTLFLLSDGTTVDSEDYARAQEQGSQVPPVVNQRLVRGERVKWCRLSGAEILEERDWPGKYIPILPVYGTETDVEGKVIYSGLVRPGKDGQRLYNYARTAFAERVALTPKSPWVAAAGQTEEDPRWMTAHEENHPLLTYNPIDVNGQALPPPQRQMAADIPAGFAQEMQHAEHDIQSALGMYAASVGQPSNEKSGRAILARQREGDVATFHYHDNLNRTIRHLGRVLLDLIPKIYDTRRVVRLLNEDGSSEEAMVAPNMGMPKAKVKGMSIYDLNVGIYDVEAVSGPSYTTKRDEAAQAMIEIAKGNPQVWMTHGDLIVKSQDWPGAEEFAERTKALMPPEMRAAIEKSEQDEHGDPKVAAVIQAADAQIQQLQQQMQQMQQVIQEAQQALKEKSEAEAAKNRELDIKEYDAETKRVDLLMPFLTPEQLAYLTTKTTGQIATPNDLVGSYVERKLVDNRTAGPTMPGEMQGQEGGTPQGMQQAESEYNDLMAIEEQQRAAEAEANKPPDPMLLAVEQLARNQEAQQARHEELMRAVMAPRVRKLKRGPDGRADHVVESIGE